MSWIKVFAVNVSVLTVLIAALEIGAGTMRLLKGKEFRVPFQTNQDISLYASPCVTMKTDVLLSHVPKTPETCVIKDGYAVGEYVKYNEKPDNASNILILGGSTSSGFYQHYSDGVAGTLSDPQSNHLNRQQ